MILKIYNSSSNPTPELKTEGAAALDIAVSENVIIEGSQMMLVPTGIHTVIPRGYVGHLKLRSSMSKKHIVMPNSPGTIDSDYRGEIKIPIRNLAQFERVSFLEGERIAQLEIIKLPEVEVQELSSKEFKGFGTTRGSGGFGSTGKN